MALDKTNLIDLARASAKAYVNPSFSYSYEGKNLSGEAINMVYTQELNDLGKTPQLFRENRNLIYTLLEEGLKEVLPVRVMQNYGQFADIKTYNFGDKPVYKVKISEASRKRAKQFVTRVGRAGRYETFKLDGYQMTVPTGVYGGAARVEWEEMLRGEFSLGDYYQLVLEGLDEAVYREIAKSLKALVGDIKPVNKTSQSAFDENEMDRLLSIADAYGKSTIYCTFEFAATMIPQKDWMSDAMKDQLWNNGYFTTYKGHRVIILPQSFEDETNAKKVIDPSLAFILPTGAEKPVKVAFEGGAQVKSFENRDWSTEIQTYQLFGVASYIVNPGICVYENTSLTVDNTIA